MKKISGILFAVALVLNLALAGPPVQAATAGEISDAVEHGIAWLASVQNADGSWGPSDTDRFGTTGLILVKLEDRAFELGFDGPFDGNYPLRQNVVKGLNFLLPYANTVGITTQIQGIPDTDGDGLGVYVNNRVYDTGILMMAIAAGRDPNQTVQGGPLGGWSYGEVLQDLADWMAYAQTDTGPGRGGWWYSAMNGGGSADQSNAGYAMIGLLYAQAPLYGYQCVIRPFVATELNYWIDYIQNNVDADVNGYDGGSAYTTVYTPDEWVNSLETGNLLTQMAFVNDNPLGSRVQQALNYISRHWNGDWVQGWGKGGPAVLYQATYCLMKGFETMGIPLNWVPNVADWYDDMATAILAEKHDGGTYCYWYSTSSNPENPAYINPLGISPTPEHKCSAELSTAWALLTLEKTAPPPIVDHFKCYQVEGGRSLAENVELQDQFVTINATVQYPKFFCNPVEKTYDGKVTPRFHTDHHLTLYNITCPEVIQRWSVEVDNQFGTQVLNVSDPVMLAVPTAKGPFWIVPQEPVEPQEPTLAQSPGETQIPVVPRIPVGLDHFLLYKADGPAVSVTVELKDQWHLESNVTVIRPVYFANPVQKTHDGKVTLINNPETHLVFYEIVGESFNRSVEISNQFVRWGSLNVTWPRLLAVPSEKKKVITQEFDHFKCYRAAGPPVGATVNLEDQFVTINATVYDPQFFCNPVEKNVCGHFVAPISHPDWHLTLYYVKSNAATPTWSVNVSNQFGQQNLIVSNPLMLAVPTQKEGHNAPVGLDHFLLYIAQGPTLNVSLKLLTDQWHSESNVTVLQPVYFANPVQKTRGCEVTPIQEPEAHLVFYKIVGGPYSTAVNIANQFVSNFTLNVTDPCLLAVPSEKIGFAELPICFIATAAYGTPMAKEIEILREFRDEYLLTDPVGQALVDIYYKVSPPLAEFITEHPVLKPVMRAGLMPVVTVSSIGVNTTPAEKMAMVGLLVLISVALAVWGMRRRGRGPEYN
jgi:hypothetical protein